METYSIYKAAEILGMSHLKLREWFKHGYIPLDDDQKSEGAGHKTELHRKDMYRIKLFQYLRNYKIDRGTISVFFDLQKQKKDADSWKGYLVYAQRADEMLGMLYSKTIKKMATFELKDKNGKKRELEAVAALTISLEQIKNEVDKLLE